MASKFRKSFKSSEYSVELLPLIITKFLYSSQKLPISLNCISFYVAFQCNADVLFITFFLNSLHKPVNPQSFREFHLFQKIILDLYKDSQWEYAPKNRNIFITVRSRFSENRFLVRTTKFSRR